MYRLYGGQNLIICQTERMRKSLQVHCAGKLDALMKVVPNPIDEEWIAQNVSKSAPTCITDVSKDTKKIIWCGRLSEVKRPALAIEAFNLLRAAGRTDTHLFMLGDGPLRCSLDEFIVQSRIQNHVTMLGHHDNSPVIMSQCDVGLITSEIEGFPNVVLEMLASGVATVVTTDCADGLAQIAGVRMATDSTAEALAQVLSAALNQAVPDPGIAIELRHRSPNKYFASIMEG